jgi:Holliday junction resolvase RusA-like endonuclease
LIEIEIPWLPPSSNHAYFNLPGGGRTLTAKGKKFKRETAAHIAQQYPKELMFFKPNIAYGLAVLFEFTELENKTWPEKASTRYKKIDASNRLKLLEDVLADVAAIDDSQNLMVCAAKRQGAVEHCTVWAWEMDNAESALRAITSLQSHRALPAV